MGEGKVPVSIVLYIDGTSWYLKKGILIRHVYRKCMYIIPNILSDVISYIMPNIIYNMLLVWAVGYLNNDRTVMSKTCTWRPLALLPILKGSACTETDEDWLRHRCLELHHRSMDQDYISYPMPSSCTTYHDHNITTYHNLHFFHFFNHSSRLEDQLSRWFGAGGGPSSHNTRS